MDTTSSRQSEDPSEPKLAMVMKLDEIRDSAPNPTAMFAGILESVADAFHAGLALLALVHHPGGRLEMKSLIDRGDVMRTFGPEHIERLAHWGLKQQEVHVMTSAQTLAAIEVKEARTAEALHFAVVPVVMGSRTRLGVLVVARASAGFSREEVELLEVIESQLDSAIVQGHTFAELELRNKEVETIYSVDRIRDKHLPFDDMLNEVLSVLHAAINAEMGFLMLYSRPTGKLELRAYTHEDLFHSTQYYQAVERISEESLKAGHLVCHNSLKGDIHSLMCIPLIMGDEIIGVFGVVNRHESHGFDETDRRLLTAIGSQIDTAIFEDLEEHKLRQVLGRSIDPTVMERLLENPDPSTLLKGERALITVLYADIRGSTALAEHTPPELFVGFINDYLGTMASVVLRNEGTLDKFVGDEVMAFFGAPHPHPDHALRAVRVGLQMQEAHAGVMASWESKGVTPSPIGVGIATGELIVGEMGSEQRTNYTVLGNAANLGARICGIAKAGQVVVSQATYDMIKDHVEAEAISGVQLKGVGGDVTVYNVTRVLSFT